MTRYTKLLELVHIFQPQTIVEIGTWNGVNATRMLKTADQFNTGLSYIGYDLFEGANDDTDKKEFNVKAHYDLSDIDEHIKKECPFAEVHLIKGDTNNTLNSITADFVFIDGGHSLETIRSDYEKVKGSAVIVFDDFYLPDANGLMPDIQKMGCNLIVQDLPHAVIDTGDPVEGGGKTAIAVVFGG